MAETPPVQETAKRRLTKDELGVLGERHAEEHLCAHGHVIVERRWRSRHGELDLITLHEDQLVAVEVKTRRGRHYGHPFEAVTEVKLHRVHRLLREFAAAHAGSRMALRVDAVAVIFDARHSHGAEPGVGDPQIEHLEDLRP